MKSKRYKRRSNILGWPLVLFLVIVVATVALFTLENNKVIDLYSGGENLEDTTTQSQVKDVDYSPATTTDNEDINTKKANGEIEQTPSIPTTDTDIQITYIANAQDFSGGQLEVRTLLNGITDGSCALTLTKGSTVIQKQSSVIQQNTTFQCEAFIVPYSELANGDWQIKLKVTSGDGRTNEASTSTTIN